MVLFDKLPNTKNRSAKNYTQNFAVGTVMVGQKHAVGRTHGLLVVLYRPPGAGGGTYKRPLEPGVIDTRKIRLPDYKKTLNVDVVLIYYTGGISVDAILDKYSGQYDEVRVYLEKDVEIYD